MIRHHPAEELLCEYAAGCLSEAAALTIATHASLCPACAAVIAAFEAIGGALLEAETPAEVDAAALNALFAAADRAPSDPPPPTAFDAETLAAIPLPLRAYLSASLGRLTWRRIGPWLDEARLVVSSPAVKASLMRVRPGTVLPRHSHRGLEYTLVLAGGFADHGVAYGRGDFALGDASSEHHPVVDDDGCLCLVVLDAPVRLLGPFGRLLNPFLRL